MVMQCQGFFLSLSHSLTLHHEKYHEQMLAISNFDFSILTLFLTKIAIFTAHFDIFEAINRN